MQATMLHGFEAPLLGVTPLNGQKTCVFFQNKYESAVYIIHLHLGHTRPR